MFRLPPLQRLRDTAPAILHGGMRMTWAKGLTDREVDLLVQAFLLPLPFGFTESEKKQILGWIKTPSAFVDMAKTPK